MRIAFIGLDFHKQTGSSRFFIDLLRQIGTVTEWYGPPGLHSSRDWARGFSAGQYDLIVIWQLHEAFTLLRERHPNVVFVPMYDAQFWGGAFHWKPSWNQAKILSFCWSLHQAVVRRGALSRYVQYFPALPAAGLAVPTPTEPHGFFWYRVRDIAPETIFTLTERTAFARLVIHNAPDPGHDITQPLSRPAHIRRLDQTKWSSDRSTYQAGLAQANVFFAPRPLEGIGMSVIEAMARGLCVVTPNNPTMNEYITHGVDGLLYDPARPAPLDFSMAAAIGQTARETIARGHAEWQAQLPGLLEFLHMPMQALKAGKGSMPTMQMRPCANGGRTLSRAHWLAQLGASGLAMLDRASPHLAIVAQRALESKTARRLLRRLRSHL